MKKQIFATIIIICLILPMFSSFAVAAEDMTMGSWSVSVSVDGANIKASVVDGKNYLFLPASADLTCLKISFESMNHDSAAITWKGEKASAFATDVIDVTALAEKDDESRYCVEIITNEGARFSLYIMQGSTIPTMYLHSYDAKQGRSWVDKSKKNETIGNMEMITADGEVIYDGALTQIKARGNSTFYYFPKKPYQIKLDKKTDLLGTGEKGKTWVLLACYNDSTIMRDKLFKDLSASLGMDYAINSHWVNLYYDGEYRGVYLLSEKVSVGSTGVDIADMEEAYEEVNPAYGDDMEIAEGVNSYGQTYQYTENIREIDSYTGGYLIEKNHDFIEEDSGFLTAKGVGFSVKSPEWAGQAAMEYISEYYQAFENAVYATDEKGNYTGYNAETGKYYYEYCDLESLVQTYLIQQLSQNVDAYVSSFYFYKDKDDIMHAGPVWDMDSTCGTGWANEMEYDRVHVTHRYLAEALVQIPGFKEAAEKYFAYYFLPQIENIVKSGGEVEANRDMLSANADMNFTIWPYVKVGNPEHERHLWSECNDYTMATEDLQTWLIKRLDVMKEMFNVPEGIKYFDDVTATDWEYEAVCFATKAGLLNGVTDVKFNPDGTATRGMVLTVIARLNGRDTTPAPGERYYQQAVNWAVANGISDGSNPDAFITRQQLATMLWRYLGEPKSDGDLSEFKDGAKVSPYAVEAMEWAVANGIFRGNSAKQLNPTAAATRAHIAQVMMNFLEQ